ncbi:MAG TPA: peptidyl-prolyl cis-trans isomerase [Thermoanaerobaculaceae bacterium]|nr:peptidyl-prolyl cis-trans isomerase [Thermoanaerobaculaceae bacterium]
MKNFRLFTVAALSLAVAAAATAADRRLIEGIVVRVNDRILTTDDIRQRAAERAAETGIAVPPAAYPELIQEAADELCLLERAAELKLEVGNDEVAAAVANLREQNHVADDAAFEKSLRQMGITLDQLKSRVRDTILVNRILSKEVGSLPVTDEELRQRYEREKEVYRIPERVHLEHLVLPLAADRSDEAAKLSEAKRVIAAARAGGDFKALVRQQVNAGGASGGDLGVVAITDLRPEVAAAVAALKPGEISEPFESSAGVHVVRLVERIPPAYKPFDEVEKDLRERELAERYRSHLSSVVEELKKRYVVEVHPDLMTAAR